MSLPPMSVPPDPSTSPLPYTTPPAYGDPRPKRPASVTTVAIIGIIFGGLGLLCITIGLVANLAGQGNAQQRQMMAEQTPEMKAVNIGLGVVGMLLSLVLLIGSIGALSLKPWARKMLIGYAVVDLIYDTVKLVLMLQWMLPLMVHALERMPAQQGADPKQMVKVMQWTMLVTTWATWVVLVGFAILVLSVMMRRRVKEAFEPTGIPGALPAMGA